MTHIVNGCEGIAGYLVDLGESGRIVAMAVFRVSFRDPKDLIIMYLRYG